jgi:hypothetical protein
MYILIYYIFSTLLPSLESTILYPRSVSSSLSLSAASKFFSALAMFLASSFSKISVGTSSDSVTEKSIIPNTSLKLSSIHLIE